MLKSLFDTLHVGQFRQLPQNGCKTILMGGADAQHSL
jgi:hypothetical protein